MTSRNVRITKRVVDGTLPGERDVIVNDAELTGFRLKVTPTGRKVFQLYYRTLTGTERRLTLGTYPEITAEEAREDAKNKLADVRHGADPSGERQTKRTAETVSELCDRYLMEYAGQHKKASSAAADRRNIDNHVRPMLGSLKVKDVIRADIERLKYAVAKGKTARKGGATKPRGRRIVTGGLGAANRVMALVSKMFTCAVEWGLRPDNPATRIKKYQEHAKDRFLSADEIARLHTALTDAEADGSITLFAAAAIRLLLYTGMRSGEATGLRWRDVDLGAQVLRLPTSKTGRKDVHLGTAALGVLAALPRCAADDHVFQAGKPGAELALRRPWHVVRERAGIGPDATLHTLRHTFASWAVMGGFTLAQTGALLGHKAAQTTMRYAHHDRHPLQQAADRVSAQIASMGANQPGAEVVPLGRRLSTS